MQDVFARPPVPVAADHPDRGLLATALGATLYTPGTCRDYAARLPALLAGGLRSGVLCLEDAVADADVAAAEANVVAQLRAVHAQVEHPPLLFVRVRAAAQIPAVVERLGDALPVLTGFVLPKVTATEGKAMLEETTAAGLLAMPGVESPEVAYVESRRAELHALRELLAAHRVLAVRVGATDLAGLWGLRRSPEQTVYDIGVVREVLADVVNVLGRDHVVSGPVWEYFAEPERVLKPQLRQTPFERRAEVRRELLRRDLDGLVREVLLDRANGFVGKTVIHPSHVRPVHALHAVTWEEWCDAQTVLGSAGGVARGAAVDGTTSMVEAGPHARWAAAVARRATAFGVLRPERSWVDLL